MGRILGIDYGRKRTGVAVTDPLQIIAGNLATVPTHTLMQFIHDYVAREQVDRIVIGQPTQLNGEPLCQPAAQGIARHAHCDV